MWSDFLVWMEQNRIRDIAAIGSFVVSVAGFTVTLYKVGASKEAANRAEAAAKSASERIRTLETVVDFAGAISLLEEIKRAHRQEQWYSLPDRYAQIRRMLISLRASNPDISDAHRISIQSALTNMSSIERLVEGALPDTSKLKSAKLNAMISEDIDSLAEVLEDIKIAGSGGRDVEPTV